MPKMELRIRWPPFGKLRDRGSFGSVSELAELAVKFRDREILAVRLHLP